MLDTDRHLNPERGRNVVAPESSVRAAVNAIVRRGLTPDEAVRLIRAEHAERRALRLLARLSVPDLDRSTYDRRWWAYERARVTTRELRRELGFCDG